MLQNPSQTVLSIFQRCFRTLRVLIYYELSDLDSYYNLKLDDRVRVKPRLCLIVCGISGAICISVHVDIVHVNQAHSGCFANTGKLESRFVFSVLTQSLKHRFLLLDLIGDQRSDKSTTAQHQ